jgi:hypothetical protein
MKRLLLAVAIALPALSAACARRTFLVTVEVDGQPDRGPINTAIAAAAPRLKACIGRDTRSSTVLTFHVDATGRAKMPPFDHLFPEVACLGDVLAGLVYPPGAPRVVVFKISFATDEERAHPPQPPSR